MARQLRIEFPGAFYHVFSRGNQKQLIFFSDEDKCFFLHCLRKACEKFGVIIHTYCLMPNHYHLFLETPKGNLSRMMHFLITDYTVYFNKKHDRHGHLFQGRFKSVLVDAVGYAKELSRYIHLNPVRSEIVNRPEEYPWSSYRYFCSAIDPEPWLVTSVILKLFGEKLSASRKAYVDFVNEGSGTEVLEQIRGSIRKGILGSEEFIARIKKDYLSSELCGKDREKPQLNQLRDKPDVPWVLSISQRILGPGNRLLIPMTILACHKRTPLRLIEIGLFFSLTLSGASNACTRAKKAIADSSPLARAMDEIEQEISGASGEFCGQRKEEEGRGSNLPSTRKTGRR